MPTLSIRDKCKINTNVDTDVFVGVQYTDGDVKVSFPLGYRTGESDDELRDDIFLLLNTLEKYTDHKKSLLSSENSLYKDDVQFPLQAYLYVIRDYLTYDYFRETEIIHSVSKRGKIEWSRTIKTQRVFVQDNEPYYLDFVTKKSQLNQNELITLIHEYCVYNSFQMVGWLFANYLPKRPRIQFQKRLFLSVLNEKIQNTFNDRYRMLFQNMKAIILWLGNNSSSQKFSFGTCNFEYVWERMIDKVYGVENKQDYFPRTVWCLNGEDFDNTYLKPDTIMKYDGKIYVLDAKYYRFGSSGFPGDLPRSESVNKQITYGEYIAGSSEFCKDGSSPVVYNAFIMPFDSKGKQFFTDQNIRHIGTARKKWKPCKIDMEYKHEYVQGVLLDVKHLMQCSVHHDSNEILEMAEAIENAFRS